MILFRIFLITSISLACCSLSAQFQVERALPTNAIGLEVSELGEVYLKFFQRIELLDKDWKVRYSFSERRLSADTRLDVTKSLKPLVYFRDYNSGVLLDNTLSQQSSELIFDWKRFGQVGALCHSIGNHYWIFDVAAMQLVRVDYSLIEVQRSGDLSMLLGVALDPSFMVEEEDHLYILDKKKGVFVFDLFGTYSHRLDFIDFSAIQVVGQHVYLMSNKQVVSYNRLTKEQVHQILPYDDVVDVRVRGKSLVILRKNELVQISLSTID
ncbi:MAG: hypothetical protein ACI84C_000209 [Flavobacteriales bacterium]|jgi:hypothetical protein